MKKIHMGNGKTSIMQIIKNTLSAKTPQVTHNIWFNTWQFSQFNMDDDLAVSLLSCLLNELAQSEEQKKNTVEITQALRFAGRFGKELLLTIADRKLGGRAADNIDSIVSGLFSQQNNPAAAVKNLKDPFSNFWKSINCFWIAKTVYSYWLLKSFSAFPFFFCPFI